jgi:hypothetical protein
MGRIWTISSLFLVTLVVGENRVTAQAPPAILPPPSVAGPLPTPGVSYFSGPGVVYYSSPKGRLFLQTDLPSTVYPAGYGAIYEPGFVSSYLGLGIFRPRGYQFNYRQGNILPPRIAPPFAP